LEKVGGNMIAEVPKDTETTLGDKILLPSYSNKIIGIIKDISIDDRSVYKKLYITLPVNIFNLDYVYIKN
jgi:hypothetical protein